MKKLHPEGTKPIIVRVILPVYRILTTRQESVQMFVRDAKEAGYTLG